jgi:hypothetical protein
MKGQGLNDLPRCELERRSSHHKGIFFEVPLFVNRLRLIYSAKQFSLLETEAEGTS